VRRDELLNHNTREAVYAYVNSHPGDHYRSILNNLGLTNGTLTYHLATLEREEFIRSERDGPLKRFYPADTEFTPGMALELTPIQKSIYDLISKSPGISQKEIAAKIGVSAPTVNYHIKAMVNARLVRLERHRKVTRCFIVESSSC
jgi:predicted transcriptional regulator